eukprot:1144640-Pelagomonas_calceolata.AAC.5
MVKAGNAEVGANSGWSFYFRMSGSSRIHKESLAHTPSLMPPCDQIDSISVVAPNDILDCSQSSNLALDVLNQITHHAWCTQLPRSLPVYKMDVASTCKCIMAAPSTWPAYSALRLMPGAICVHPGEASHLRKTLPPANCNIETTVQSKPSYLVAYRASPAGVHPAPLEKYDWFHIPAHFRNPFLPAMVILKYPAHSCSSKQPFQPAAKQKMACMGCPAHPPP